MNYEADGSKCYNNEPAKCTTYGRLYDWATAMGLTSTYNSTLYSAPEKYTGVCPSGWHIPNNAEWVKLYRYVDGNTGISVPYNSSTAGKYLKTTSSWESGSNSQDTYGFSALPSGQGYLDGSFHLIGVDGVWWSTSEYNGSYAYRADVDYNNEEAHDNYGGKGYLHSVRCLQD